MPTQRFPFPGLPDDLGLMVLNTMEYHEIIAFSFTSKKSLSMVQALRLPIRHVKLVFPNEIAVLFDRVYYSSYLKIHGNDNQIRSLNDLPASVDIRAISFGNSQRLLTWSNQGKTIGNWINHFCSISNPQTRYQVSIETKRMRFEIHSLRNTFPKLRKITIKCSRDESNKNCLSSSETVLRAFLPNLESLVLYGLPPNRSIGSIGMANLNFLELYLDSSQFDLKLEDFLSLNVKHCMININEFSLREVNRFFKLWIKGSNPRLEDLHIYGYSKTIPDWNLLLKGLKAVEKEEEGEIAEDEEEEESVGESEGEGEAGEPQVGRVKAVEAENEPEDEALEVPENVQEEEVAEESELEDEDDEEYEEEEEDEEDIEDDYDYDYEDEESELEDEESELEDEEEYEDEEEPEEAQIAPVAPVPRVVRVVPVAPVVQEEEEVPLEQRAGAENAGIVKKYIIRNSLGVCAEIETEFNITYYVTVSVKFTVKK
ncbi:hypothetical protein B9Z55_011171 [Caenorhabditis nigoni]|uniref:F-box domain-containing protein n=1 Tax=Caenorhabditis nigoni TaxID=1611254 RepID=A0A2G5UIZ2_9PELO|nr:hypothetical protein B9Z55_011171 [Caenorhabditis nigoni]